MDNDIKLSATKFLRDDHKRVLGLFRQVEASKVRAPEMRSGVIGELFMELEIHMQAEEDFFYPAVLGVANLNCRSTVEEGIREHDDVKLMIKEIRELDIASPDYEPRFSEIVSTVEEHIRKEEVEVFPETELKLDALEELGRKMLSRREELLKEPRYRSVQPKRVQDLHGGEQMRKKVG